MFSKLKFWLLITCCLLYSTGSAMADSALQKVLTMPQASLLVSGKNSQPIISHQPDMPRIPASTLKILTAWMAIQHWGLDHRFHTDFYLDDNKNLWVKGYGDPMLVSEEIELIAHKLVDSGMTEINRIHFDESYFQPGIIVEGQGSSDNPYDAPLAPLSANFNTINVQMRGQTLRSAEPQTPLTSTARQLASKLKSGKHRVNIGDSALAGRHFSELLQAKLRTAGVKVNASIVSGTLPTDLILHYRHHNSHTLEMILRSMLRYSTNFTANQLLLMLGAERYGAPASMEKARRTAMESITSRFDWRGLQIREGAGLSRENRISARQMIELLHAFQPWKHLLHSDIQGVQAKSGTLNGISSYAGYLDAAHDSMPFALFIAHKVPFNFRLQVINDLL